MLMGTRCVSKHLDLQMVGLKLTNMINFCTLKVVGRGSETQLQVGENLNTLSSGVIPIYTTIYSDANNSSLNIGKLSSVFRDLTWLITTIKIYLISAMINLKFSSTLASGSRQYT